MHCLPASRGVEVTGTPRMAFSLYYAVFAASSVVFLLPYLLMFPAALRLRIKDPERPRPFRVPGGTVTLAVLVAGEALIWRGVHPRKASRSRPRPLGTGGGQPSVSPRS